MTILVNNQGEVDALKAWLNHTAGQNFILRLFSNNITPAETDTEATYTEVSGTGYAGATLTGLSWTVTPGAPGTAAYAQQTFTAGSSWGSVYGYYYTQAVSGRAQAAERFSDAPWTININDQAKITPQITAD